MVNIPERDVGIDVARAGLIAMMIFYHSFGNAQSATTLDIDQNFNINRWMGLVSGSFPFLMGFLIGFRYLGDVTPRFSEIRRLLARASKLIAGFVVINVFLVVLDLFVDKFPIPLPNTPSALDILLANPSSVAYDLLMPLGEIVLIGAVVSFVRMYFKNNFCLLLILTIIALIFAQSGNLLLLYLACGIVGLALGAMFGQPVISQVLKKYWIINLLGLVPGIILATSQTNGPDNGLLYLASVAGLFFVFHSLGRFAIIHSDGLASRVINLFARNSLIIYVVHIPVLLIVVKLTDRIFTETDLWLSFSLFSVFIFISMGILAHCLHLCRPKLDQGLSRLNMLRRPLTGG